MREQCRKLSASTAWGESTSIPRHAIAATVASTACRSTDDYYAKRRHLEATDAGERTAALLVEQLEAF